MDEFLSATSEACGHHFDHVTCDVYDLLKRFILYTHISHFMLYD